MSILNPLSLIESYRTNSPGPMQFDGRAADIQSRYVGKSCVIYIATTYYHATITGRNQPLACIVPLDSTLPSLEFAWSTVEYVMQRCDGRFRSQ